MDPVSPVRARGDRFGICVDAVGWNGRFCFDWLRGGSQRPDLIAES